MQLKERVRIVTEILDATFPVPQSGLNYSTPYTLLIATLLSAQCHDDQVNRVAPNLFKVADTPFKMQQLSEKEIGALIYSCGFYHTKARFIKQLSQQLCDHYAGQVPLSFEALEQLPGVGHKTASVVLGHITKTPTFPVDTHIQRLAVRWQLCSVNSVYAIEKALKSIFPENLWFKRHLQMISYGRKFCNRNACRPEQFCAICSRINA